LIKNPTWGFFYSLAWPISKLRHSPMVAPLREKLIALTEPLLGQLGYELVDLEYARGARMRSCASLSTAAPVLGSMTVRR